MIYIECNPDYALVRALTRISGREIVHQSKGKFEVCNQLRRRTNSTGLIDEDPNAIQPPFVKEARLEGDFSEHDIKVLHHRSSNNRLIVLCPRLEEWILRAATQARIDVRQYDLPNDAKQLHTEINIILVKFERLLADLKGSSARLKTLKRLLETGR